MNKDDRIHYSYGKCRTNKDDGNYYSYGKSRTNKNNRRYYSYGKSGMDIEKRGGLVNMHMKSVMIKAVTIV